MRVKDWDLWQSYRKGRGQPPWIKVHRRLMRDVNWVAMTDAQRGQLVAIWMLAADNHGVIPASAKMIQKLCHMEREPDLKLLIELGFLERRQPDANLTPSECQDGTVLAPTCPPRIEEKENRSRRETEAEGEEKRKIPGRSKQLLPDNWTTSPVHYELGKKLGLSVEEVDEEVQKMRDWSLGNGEKRRNWDSVFNNWLKNGKARHGYRGQRPLQDDSKSLTKAADRLIERSERGEFSFGPRPGTAEHSRMLAERQNVIQLLPKGRSE